MNQDGMTVSETNEAVVRGYYQAINNGDLRALDTLVSPGFVHHTRGMPAGLPPYKHILLMFRRGFPDIHNHIDALIVADDLVTARTTTSGTHQGTFLGHAPTGKQFEANGIDIFRLHEGRIVERWGVFDTITMLQQLGLYTPSAA
ncbi:MAG: ester cyclase [Anaerolineales bacterium]|nr:ester cyclase [Anaerolineales bacterium]MCB8953024.1 ester cyclase [Ardenticatenales bacterium]